MIATSDRADRARIRLLTASRLKLLGGGIVLLAFATQNILLDYFGTRSASIRTAMLERAVIDKGAQLSELLYLTFPAGLDSALGGVKSQKIREAAQKRALSSMMPLVSNDSLSRQTATDLANRLQVQASAVHDYTSFASFLESINRSDQVFATAWQAQLERIERRRDVARWSYLALYLVGSVLVLLGEVRSTREQGLVKQTSGRSSA